MLHHVMRKWWVWVGAAWVLLFAYAAWQRHHQEVEWVYVTGASLPSGVYRVEDAPDLERGRVVEVCLRGETASLFRWRGYVRGLSTPRCPLPGVAMTKLLAALPGDTVVVSTDSVRVVGYSAVASRIHETDRKGRPLPNATGVHVLGSNECFVISTWYARSLDSRHVGAVDCPDPPHRLMARRAEVADTLAALGRILAGNE